MKPIHAPHENMGSEPPLGSNSSCVTPSKCLYLSEPQFPPLENGGMNSPTAAGLLVGWNEITFKGSLGRALSIVSARMGWGSLDDN